MAASRCQSEEECKNEECQLEEESKGNEETEGKEEGLDDKGHESNDEMSLHGWFHVTSEAWKLESSLETKAMTHLPWKQKTCEAWKAKAMNVMMK